MKLKHIFTLIALGFIMALGGLAVSETPSAQAKVSDGIPPGVYATNIAAADLPPLPPEFLAILVGEWEMEFTESGSYIVTRNGEVVIVGRYTSNSQNLVMTDVSGALACKDEPGIATGAYQWSLYDNELVLTPFQDRCFGRETVLTAHILEKQ